MQRDSLMRMLFNKYDDFKAGIKSRYNFTILLKHGFVAVVTFYLNCCIHKLYFIKGNVTVATKLF